MNAWTIMVDAVTVVRIWSRNISARVLPDTNLTGPKEIALVRIPFYTFISFPK